MTDFDDLETIEPSQEGIDEELLHTLTARERVALSHGRAWRTACLGAMALCLGLVVVVVILVNQRQVKYIQVYHDPREKVSLTTWTDRPWTLSEAQTRHGIEAWLKRCRAFGTDETQVAWNRFLCWNQAYKPAQRWVKAWVDALPLKDVGKVGIRVAQPPLPDMKSVPPATGRTWEVFWEEEWSTAKSPLIQRKLFIALVTVQLKEPTTDAEATNMVQANHLGVWIENISIEERSGSGGK